MKKGRAGPDPIVQFLPFQFLESLLPDWYARLLRSDPAYLVRCIKCIYLIACRKKSQCIPAAAAACIQNCRSRLKVCKKPVTVPAHICRKCPCTELFRMSVIVLNRFLIHSLLKLPVIETSLNQNSPAYGYKPGAAACPFAYLYNCRLQSLRSDTELNPGITGLPEYRNYRNIRIPVYRDYRNTGISVKMISRYVHDTFSDNNPSPCILRHP